MNYGKTENHTLLYLSPDKAVQLGKAFEKLENLFGADESSGLMLHLVRRDLFDLIEALSPLSKTRKLVSEMLDHTENCPPGDQERIRELIASVGEIYRFQEAKNTIEPGALKDRDLKTVGNA